MAARDDSDGSKAKPAAGYLRVLGVVFVAVLIASAPFVIVGELPGDRWLSARDSHAPAFAGLGVLLLALDVLLPIPSSVIGVMLGARLGLALGFFCCLLGLIAGHAAGYGLGRLAPERWTTRAASAPSMFGVLVSRPVPVLAEALAVSAGAMRMPLGQFLAAALIGDLIYAGALAASGAALLPAGRYLTALVLPMALVVIAGLASRRSAARTQP